MTNAPRVLIVDDDGTQRRVYHRILETHGFEASSAASGAEALELACGGGPLPDVILSDIAMPGMDGVAFLRRLRSNSATASIPAILMTGLPIPPGLMQAAVESLGIGPVHIKGGPIEDLLARIKMNLSVHRRPGALIDPLRRTISIGGTKLPELPARRFQLLCALLRHPLGLSRDELLEQVWDGKDDLNVVSVTIMRLREDLKSLPFVRIETFASGYRLAIGDAPH